LSKNNNAEKSSKEKTQEKSDIDKEKKLYDRIDDLDTQVNTAAENGLFKAQPNVSIDKMTELMLTTRKNLEAKEYSECETNLTAGIDLFSNAIHSTKRSWRFLHVYAGHLWLYMIAILVSIFAIYYFGLSDCLVENITAQKEQRNEAHNSTLDSSSQNHKCALSNLYSNYVVGFYAATWGCVGAVLRGLWWLKERVDVLHFRDSWTIYFLSVPFLGGILGAIVYFLLVGGLLTVTNNVDIMHPIPIIVLAALAGFNWEWAIKVFKAAGESLSPKGTDSK
jgi:hypothetical protein